MGVADVCEVKVGAKVLSASLVEKSEGGFGVLIDRLDGLRVGKKVELRTDTGCFTVQITYINEVARPQDVVPGGNLWFRLGMKKTRRRSFFFF